MILILADQVEKELAEIRANPTKEYVADGSFPNEVDLVDAGNGIKVHKDIASRVSLMLQDAATDGGRVQPVIATA